MVACLSSLLLPPTWGAVFQIEIFKFPPADIARLTHIRELQCDGVEPVAPSRQSESVAVRPFHFHVLKKSSPLCRPSFPANPPLGAPYFDLSSYALPNFIAQQRHPWTTVSDFHPLLSLLHLSDFLGSCSFSESFYSSLPDIVAIWSWDSTILSNRSMK